MAYSKAKLKSSGDKGSFLKTILDGKNIRKMLGESPYH
jgi:hypothetical protein